MSGVYRVKRPQGVWITGAEQNAVAQPMRPGLILLWSVATAAGVGAGWYLVQRTGIALLWAIPISVFQGLLLLPNQTRALKWMVLTCVGWLFALAFMFVFAFPLALAGRSSTTVSDFQIGSAILLLIFVGVPTVASLQCLAIYKWAHRQQWPLWFGASACSFPVAALFGALLVDTLAPVPCLRGFSGCLPGLVEVQSFELKLFVIGALWGGVLGWGMARMPEVRAPNEGRGDTQAQ